MQRYGGLATEAVAIDVGRVAGDEAVVQIPKSVVYAR